MDTLTLAELPARPPPPADPFPLKRILVACDLTPASANAAARAALLAREHGAWLRLLCVRPRRSQLAAAQASLDALAAQLQERTGVAVLAQAVAGSVGRELKNAAADADLLVLRCAGRRPLVDWLAGWHPARLLRHCERPVLVVRKPAAVAYRRVLASVAFDGRAAHVIAAAAGMLRGPQGEVLQALEGPVAELRPGPVAAEAVLAAQRLRTVVQEVMTDGTGARRLRDAPMVAVDHSPPLLLRKARAAFAELVVLARRPGEEDPLAGSDARQVVAGSVADVLLLPPPASGH